MYMRSRVVTAVAVGSLMLAGAASAQLPGLKAGTVTATVDGAAFSAPVSIAVVDEEATLVLTHLGNLVQIQVPGAKVGSFPIRLDDDGGLVDVIIGLRAGRRRVTPVSGSLTIETLTAEAASGRFEFEGKDIETDAPVKVTAGRFEVTLTQRR
jgi:hypothetical protein